MGRARWGYEQNVYLRHLGPREDSHPHHFLLLTSLLHRFIYTMSRYSSSTVNHEWDPWVVLDLPNGGTCVGMGKTTHRPCRNPGADVYSFRILVDELSSEPLDAAHLRRKLHQLANLGLCNRWHRARQPQGNEVVHKWTMMINKRRAELEAAARRDSTNASSSTASFATARSFLTAASHATRRSPSVTNNSTRTLPALSEAEHEAESLQRSIDALAERMIVAQRRLDRLRTPLTPRLDPDRPLTRVQTADLPSLHLSRTSSATLSAASSRSTYSTSSRSTSPARSTSSRHSSSSSSSADSSTQPRRRPQSPSASSTLPSPPATPVHRRQAAPTSTPSSRSNTATPQRHASSSRTPAAQASVAPTSQPCRAPQCTITHVRRLPFTDECPICYEGGPLSTHPAAELVWCTSSCGRTVHKSCFDGWRAQCLDSYRTPDCPVCREDWDKSCACGGRSTCTKVHVQRKEASVTCPVCLVGMNDNTKSELQWCKDGCGNNIHAECMETWTANRVAHGREASCTMCRAEWTSECSC